MNKWKYILFFIKTEELSSIGKSCLTKQLTKTKFLLKFGTSKQFDEHNSTRPTTIMETYSSVPNSKYSFFVFY